MIGMSQIYILVEYNRKWEKVDVGFWRWFGVCMSKGFVVYRSINFLELEETIYDRTSIDRNIYAIEITHKPAGDIFGDIATPTLISNDSDIIDLMFLYKEKQGMTLHVIIKEKCDKGKAIYVRGDDDLSSNGGDALGFHDDYFECRINEEISFVARFVPTELLGSYEHPLQICATSTPINERISGFNPTPITGSIPTPEETVLEEVANEDDGVDKVGDDVPERGDEVRKGCDGVPEEDDSRCQHSESEEIRFVPLISSDSGRNDGSDLMVGKHFDSKEELNTKLNLVAINGKFKMNVKKSTKSLKEVVCVDEPNCLWRVRATKMPGSNFFVIRQYNGIHTCSLMNRSINHRQASSRVIGTNMKEHFIDCKQPHNIPEEVRAIKVVESNVKMFRKRPRLTHFPSQGEYIVKKYKCATCGQKGHNSKKCPKLSHPSNVRSST
ncbi:hypothetical protein TIFTF001_024914 [Ficus carica]|uniref:CCHC-type domain-containing protein n=1 Tax=Ficus carica TaxID=3494 RepID=A0AA88AM45_FICCA|nr:hypothetical protein TIFTF001_024914 [Ficus carica]